MLKLWLRVYPELARIPPAHREAALEEARDNAFDATELLGLAFGLACTVGATRYVVAEGITYRIEAFLANFLLAVPLLAVSAGPFFVRRTRRGLQRYLEHHASEGATHP